MHPSKGDFPYFTHHPEVVYLDSAATSHKPAMVIDRCREYVERDYATIHRGQYISALASEHLYRSVRQQLATHINAPHDEEVIFCASSTHASNLAVEGLLRSGRVARGATIVISVLEHHSTLLPWIRAVQTHQLKLHRLSIDEQGEIMASAWKELEGMKPAAVVVSAVSNVTGTVLDLAGLRSHLPPDCLLLVDASQHFPHLPIDVQAWDADMVRATGHKCYALNGSGFLRAKKELLADMEPFLLGGGAISEVTLTGYTLLDAPDKFEPGTPNVLAVGSLGKALEYIQTGGGFETLMGGEQPLISFALEHFATLERQGLVRLLGQKTAKERIGVFSFACEGRQRLAQTASLHNISLRAGTHCAQPLHTALHLTGTCRISFGAYTDVNDLYIFFNFLEQTLAKSS